jgi:hypothetical protein
VQTKIFSIELFFFQLDRQADTPHTTRVRRSHASQEKRKDPPSVWFKLLVHSSTCMLRTLQGYQRPRMQTTDVNPHVHEYFHIDKKDQDEARHCIPHPRIGSRLCPSLGPEDAG